MEQSVQDRDKWLVRWGWIGVLFLAPVGAIIGIVLITRNRLGHGISQLVLSVAWLWVVFVLFAGASEEVDATDRQEANRATLCAQYQWSKDVGDTAALVDVPAYCELD